MVKTPVEKIKKKVAEKKTTLKAKGVKRVKGEKEEKVKKTEVKEVIEPVVVSVPVEETVSVSKKSEYLFGLGRRKTAIARVRVYKKGEGKVTVNQKEMKIYFPTIDLQGRVLAPIEVVGQTGKLDVTVVVSGGGRVSQAEAVRHGVSRALLLLNPNFKKPLKKAGYLTRDPRQKERKKPGLKRARKAPQWTKR
jgi:small subunit ribosomal protein S9